MLRTIEKGQEKDAEAIAHLLLKVWKKNYVDFLPTTFLENLNLPKQIERHRSYLNKQVKYFLIHHKTHDLMGFCSFGKNRGKVLAADWELYTLYVDPDFQRQGIGSSLLQKVLQDLPTGNPPIGCLGDGTKSLSGLL